MHSDDPSSERSSRAAGRQREILEAAERVFGRAGYWNATTAEIAGAVGLTQPALYRYFSSKRELFLAALRLRQQEIEASMREALSGPGTAREKMRRIALSTASLALSHPSMAMLRIQAVALAAQDDEIRERVHATFDRLFAGHQALVAQAAKEGALDEGVDPQALAASIAGQAFLLYVAITIGHPLANEQDAERAVDGLLALLEPLDTEVRARERAADPS